MSLIVLLIVVILVLSLIGSLPTWGYSSQWGYRGASPILVILLIVLALYFTGHLNHL